MLDCARAPYKCLRSISADKQLEFFIAPLLCTRKKNLLQRERESAKIFESKCNESAAPSIMHSIIRELSELEESWLCWNY